jgi:hypothetical protein
MNPTLPFNFEYSGNKDYLKQLSITKYEGYEVVSWPPAGVSFKTPTYEYWPNRADVAAANGGLVTFHGDKGYSIGSFHEFFVAGTNQRRIGFQMGRLEVTFGTATPLMAYLFDGSHEDDFFDPWDHLSTVRIVGATDIQEAELAFTNAAIRYYNRFKASPTLWEMNLNDFFPDEEEDEYDNLNPSVLVESAAIRDVEPLRFYYQGLTQSDPVAACLYFYRVLEYYSFLTYRKELSSARHDTALSDDEFLRRCLDTLSRDDKGPILRLVNQITDKGFLENAKTIELVKTADADLFGQNLYAFRNSIVHGKDSSGYVLHSPSVFNVEVNLISWRVALRSLAQNAINRFGRKLF